MRWGQGPGSCEGPQCNRKVLKREKRESQDRRGGFKDAVRLALKTEEEPWAEERGASRTGKR